MEPNGLPGGMFSNMSGGGGGSGGGSGLLGLEMSLNHHSHPPQPPNATQLHHRHHQFPVVANFHDPPPQPSSANKQGGYNININAATTHHPFASKPRNNVSNVSAVNSTASDEDELNPATEDSGDGKRKGTSPWQRMKWTDNMVRLLIMVVFYVGDEVGSEGPDPASKKKAAGGASGGGVLQKKGKWKSVSRAMMERGFFVSPQQCEDKFNDLNKRYKRVNDILGKGTACRVVENQNLLETMDHLSPKMKEEVKKLLNSKHLFFREMCAYHNSCGGGTGAQGTHQSSPPEAAADHNQNQLPPHNQPVQTAAKCLHTNEKNGRAETEVSKIAKGGSGEDEDDYDDDDDEDEDDEYGDDEDECVVERSHNNNNGHEDHGHNGDPRFSRKKAKVEMAMVQQLSGEVMGVFQDVTKSLWEKRQWMKTRLMQLEEQRVGYQGQAFELEKERLKWVKFSCKKERDMEAEKLRNERLKLENDRMMLLLRQKELELIDLQQQHFSSNKRASDPSSITG